MRRQFTGGGALVVRADCRHCLHGRGSCCDAQTAFDGPVTAVARRTTTVAAPSNPRARDHLDVEYGTSTSYGSRPIGGARPGNESQAVSAFARVAASRGKRTYHDRFVATSQSAGSGPGEEGILTTSSGLPCHERGK